MTHIGVLNTRPLHQADNLTRLIEHKGGRVFQLPVFAIAPIAFQPVNLDDFDYLIFQSSNAVDYFFHQQKIKLTRAKIIAIGSATEKALHKAGFDQVITPDHFSSEGILAMPLLQSILGKSILIICGENPKALLSEKLMGRGAKVTTLHSYQRTPVIHDMNGIFRTLMLNNITVVVSTSAESFFYLMRLFSAHTHRAWLLKKTLCVINERMAIEAQKVGFKSVIQADNATDEAILKRIYLGT
jgi:uroporphyrinogen-III synthase